METYRTNRELESFENMLEKLEMSENDYINAIRCSSERVKLFYRRQTDAVNVNPYLRELLETWEANHDIQYIIDPYATITYLFGYCFKTQFYH